MIRLRRWQDAPLWAKSLLFGLLPALVMLATTAIGYRLHQAVDRADADLSRAVAIQNDIRALHILLAEASLAIRGYALTERQDFIAPYARARSGIPTLLEAMRGRIRDADVLALHAEISRLFDAKFRDLDALRTAVDAGVKGPDLLPQLVASKAVLDELRLRLGEMSTREAALVTAFAEIARAATERSYRFNLVASLAILGGSAAAVLLFLGGLLRRIDRLAENAERLVHDQPLLPMPQRGDELGQLAERLQRASLLLAERAVAAQAASAAKSRFLSRTSHELRTPLNAIIGHAQLLAEREPTAATEAACATIDTAARQLLALIDDLLLIATDGGDDAPALKPEAVEVAAVIDEAQTLLAPLAAQRSITVVRRPADPAAVAADRRRLRQIIINLLGNALKFSSPGGRVEIGWQRDGSRLRLAITDNGPGIAAADLGRLFVPLERLDAEQRGIAGSGLGLALSKQLAVAMAGTIEVDSQVGVGSTFSLLLPLAADGAATTTAPAATAPVAAMAAPGSGRRLLLAAHQPGEKALIAALLARRPGWQLACVADRAALAHALAATEPTHLLLGSAAGADLGAWLADWTALPPAQRPPLAVLGAAAAPGACAPEALTRLPLPLQLRDFLDWLERPRDATA